MTRLEECPVEIVENIVQCLNLVAIGHLRLTSKLLCWKTSQQHFRTFFRSKSVDITGQALQDLVALTQPNWLGCETRNLTLVGIVNNTKGLEAMMKRKNYDSKKRGTAEQDLQTLQQREREYQQLLQSGKLVHLLSDAFKQIATNSESKKLSSLTLEVVVYREDAQERHSPADGGSWKLIWQRAAETFRIVMAAMKTSKLDIECLNVFADKNVLRCSLSCNELSNNDFGTKNSSCSLSTLKSLLVSVSQRVLEVSIQDQQRTGDPADEIDWSDESDRDMAEVEAEARDEKNFTGLASFLRVSSRLKSLFIHYYILRDRRNNSIHFANEKLFQRVAEIDRLPELELLSLQGVYLREEDLLSLLERLNLAQLFMQHVNMTAGTFGSIFDYCASETSRMKLLYVDDLMVGQQLLYFEGPGQSKFNAGDGGDGTNTLKREGADVKKPIRFRIPSGLLFPVDTPEKCEWRRKQIQYYGPP